jgi:hypothetical protein
MARPKGSHDKVPRMTRAEGREQVSVLNERKRDIVTMVAVCGALTTEQINRSFFQPKDVVNRDGVVVRAARQDPNKVSEHCRRQLRWLFDAGYLSRSEQAHTSTEGKPFVYRLTTKGTKYLKQFSDVPEEFLNLSRGVTTGETPFLTHLLRTNDVRVEVILACARHGLPLTEWRDERALWREHSKDKMTIQLEGNRVEAAVIPDGFFVIQTPQRNFNHFLECDLSTETARSTSAKSRDFARKISAYEAFLRRPSQNVPSLYEKKYGTPRGRVLIVTTAEERLKTLKALIEELGGAERYWLTTFERIAQGDILTSKLWSVATHTEEERLIFDGLSPQLQG